MFNSEKLQNRFTPEEADQDNQTIKHLNISLQAEESKIIML